MSTVQSYAIVTKHNSVTGILENALVAQDILETFVKQVSMRLSVVLMKNQANLI